jgi:hypothetical protein
MDEDTAEEARRRLQRLMSSGQLPTSSALMERLTNRQLVSLLRDRNLLLSEAPPKRQAAQRLATVLQYERFIRSSQSQPRSQSQEDSQRRTEAKRERRSEERSDASQTYKAAQREEREREAVQIRVGDKVCVLTELYDEALALCPPQLAAGLAALTKHFFPFQSLRESVDSMLEASKPTGVLCGIVTAVFEADPASAATHATLRDLIARLKWSALVLDCAPLEIEPALAFPTRRSGFESRVVHLSQNSALARDDYVLPWSVVQSGIERNWRVGDFALLAGTGRVGRVIGLANRRHTPFPLSPVRALRMLWLRGDMSATRFVVDAAQPRGFDSVAPWDLDNVSASQALVLTATFRMVGRDSSEMQPISTLAESRARAAALIGSIEANLVAPLLGASAGQQTHIEHVAHFVAGLCDIAVRWRHEEFASVLELDWRLEELGAELFSTVVAESSVANCAAAAVAAQLRCALAHFLATLRKAELRGLGPASYIELVRASVAPFASAAASSWS